MISRTVQTRLVFKAGLVFLLLLLGCQNRQKAAEVSFAFAGDPAELAAYETLISAFEEAHPDINIQIRHSPSRQDFQQKLVTMVDGGEPPDVLLLNYRRFVRFAADGDLHPVGPHLPDLERGAFFPIALDAFTWQGELWCVPQNISSLVVYYNRDLFDAAQIDYPAADWQWDEFVQTAKLLTADGVHGAGIEPNLYRLAPLVWQANGTLFTQADGLLPAIPQNLTALERLVALQMEHRVVPSQIEAVSQSAEDRFLAGSLAIFFDSRRLTPTLRRSADFSWDVAPLPMGETRAGVLHSDGYCLGNESSPQTLAFIRFATSAAGQEIMAQTGRTVPSRRSIARSSAFLNPALPPSNSAVWLDEVADLKIVPLHPNWIQIEELASAEIEQAFYGHSALADALHRIRQRSETLR